MLGAAPELAPAGDSLDLPYVAVKAPMFSFRRLAGADPVLGVEMASTGEVGCFGRTPEEALKKALLATGFQMPQRGVLLSLGPVGDKYSFTSEARALVQAGLRLYATAGTAEILQAEGIAVTPVDKGEDAASSTALALLRSGAVDLVVNLPRTYDEAGRPDGFRLRRAAADLEIPLLTDLALARAIVRALSHGRAAALGDLEVRPWHDYLALTGAEPTAISP